MEQIVKRITSIMDQEGLSPSSFADEIGIGRPLLSHVLSGRNNPSLQLILKILEKYPHYSADWLLLGKRAASQNEALPDNSEQDDPANQENAPKSKSGNRGVIPQNEDVVLVMHSDRTYSTFTPRK